MCPPPVYTTQLLTTVTKPGKLMLTVNEDRRIQNPAKDLR